MNNTTAGSKQQVADAGCKTGATVLVTAKGKVLLTDDPRGWWVPSGLSTTDEKAAEAAWRVLQSKAGVTRAMIRVANAELKSIGNHELADGKQACQVFVIELPGMSSLPIRQHNKATPSAQGARWADITTFVEAVAAKRLGGVIKYPLPVKFDSLRELQQRYLLGRSSSDARIQEEVHYRDKMGTKAVDAMAKDALRRTIVDQPKKQYKTDAELSEPCCIFGSKCLVF